jgi:serum/glucocorticoid-regulated kinase 2
MEYVF